MTNVFLSARKTIHNIWHEVCVIGEVKLTAMDATLNTNNESQQNAMQANSGKSELMQFFENQVNDMYWAYKDLLKAISEVND